VGEGARLGGGAEHIPETSHSHRRCTYSNQTRDGVLQFRGMSSVPTSADIHCARPQGRLQRI
jgi:hypothetical protein